MQKELTTATTLNNNSDHHQVVLPPMRMYEQPQILPQGPSGPLQQGGVLENQQ